VRDDDEVRRIKRKY
jgi:tubulin polyglutamylase TTLL1